MKPSKKTRPPIQIKKLIEESIRHWRDLRGLSQGEFAAQMAAIGFNWSRTTVVAVEGGGRGRAVNFPELIGVAQVLGITVADLLIPAFIEGDTIEIAPGGLVAESAVALATKIMPIELLQSMASDIMAESLRQEIERLRGVFGERLRAMGNELHSTAGWFEETADKWINAKDEETTK